MDIRKLPGGDLIARGMRNLSDGNVTAEALLAAIGRPRLESLGFTFPGRIARREPEHRLYELLASSDADSAHSRYNALIRKLVSFERAAQCASWRTGPGSGLS